MAVDLSFAGALIDNSRSLVWSDRRVLGLRLRKFCLWHRLLLRTIESPFVTGKEIRLRDIRVAVGICRTGFGRSMVRKPWLIPLLIWIRVIIVSLLPRRRPKEGDLNPMQKAILRHTEAFMSYCGDYLQEPKFSVVPQEGAKDRIPRGRPPAELEQVAQLIRLGIDERRAWEMPVGLANYYRVCALQLEGVPVDFIDLEEQAFQSKLPKEYRWTETDKDFKCPESQTL